MDDRNIRAAMEDAKQESHTIGLRLLDMEKLQQRKSQIDTFVAQCQSLLGEATQEVQTKPLFELPAKLRKRVRLHPDSFVDAAKEANWEKAQRIFIETNNKPLMLSELVREFQKRDFKLSEKNAKEVIRAAVKNKREVFAYDNAAFTYWLKDFPVAEPSPAEQQ